MTSRDFCFWLQGFIEVTGAEKDVREITEAQIRMIKKHLDMVFVHEIDPSMPNKKLDEMHNPMPARPQFEYPPKARC